MRTDRNSRGHARRGDDDWRARKNGGLRSRRSWHLLGRFELGRFPGIICCFSIIVNISWSTFRGRIVVWARFRLRSRTRKIRRGDVTPVAAVLDRFEFSQFGELSGFAGVFLGKEEVLELVLASGFEKPFVGLSIKFRCQRIGLNFLSCTKSRARVGHLLYGTGRGQSAGARRE